jgi:hypothetical protein
MRARSSFLFPAALGLAVVSFASSARAQVVTFSNSGSGGVMTHAGAVTLPDDVLRGMLTLHENAVLQPNAENNYVVLVIDANDQYVSSRSSKMKIVSADAGEGMHTFTSGDSGAVKVLVRSLTDGVAAASANPGTVMISRSSDGGDGGHANGVMGTGVNMGDVAGLGMKRYDAGTIAPGQIMVSIIKLK